MIDIGDRLELFVDDFLIDRTAGVEVRLHNPVAREVALLTDRLWEGSNCGYLTVFQDGDLYRMYYRGSGCNLPGDVKGDHPWVACYAESSDGIHWDRPDLGLIESGGSKDNNIIWDGPGTHNFCPFKDPNPDCSPEAQYKALGGVEKHDGGLLAFQSADGVRWSKMREDAVITEGKFDSQNLAFWDALRGEYREYHRHFEDGRDIMTCASRDFLDWTKPTYVNYSPGRITQFYTNQIIPYYRAPHIYLGFPTRYVAGRGKLTRLNEFISETSERFGTDYTDGGFMTSRDGMHFSVWPQAFIRPGPVQQGRWCYGANYQCWGMVETAAESAPEPMRSMLPPDSLKELSVYATEGGWVGESRALRRYTLRIDGFVSAYGPLSGGEVLTKPIMFAGKELVLNMATSVAGSIRVEIQDGRAGRTIEGFSLDDCQEVFGDEVERVVHWSSGSDLSRLAGETVRLRFVLRDADLYSFRFRQVD